MTTSVKERQPLSDTEVEEYLRFLHANPHSRVFAPLAEYLIQRGRLTEAEQICRSGLEANPDFAAGHLAYARVLFKLLRYQEALERLKQTLRFNRSNVDAYLIAAEIYLIHNRHQAAQQACVKVLEIDPQNIEVEQLLTRITQATPARDPLPTDKRAANRSLAITDTSPSQHLRQQQPALAEKPLKKIIADVVCEAEALIDQLQQPFYAESSGSQPRSMAEAPSTPAKSDLRAVDLAQAVIDSYADRVLPVLTDLSPPRLPRTDLWINMLWMIVIIGLLGCLVVLGIHFGSSRKEPPVTSTSTGTGDAQTSNPQSLEK